MTQAEIPFATLLDRALAARLENIIDLQEKASAHFGAFRLFNGFLEGSSASGSSNLVVDLYARTLVVFNYAEDPAEAQSLVEAAGQFYLDRLPWLQAVLVKTRNSGDEQSRKGILAAGQSLSRKVREQAVWYTVDLTLNLDASFYLDTRGLRAWAIEHLAGRRVLNTFAYTGSLGVAAAAGGARQVVQLDLNRRFLNLAKDSYALNGFPVQRADFLTGDFFIQAARLNRSGQLFDCVFVDPPFFSATARGKVDLVSQSHRIINKARPLVAHNGWLVAINNALFLSGAEYLHVLQDLCADGFLSIEELIPVPPDFTGFPTTRIGRLPVDPAPFNHSTKIAILRVQRKDQRIAE